MNAPGPGSGSAVASPPLFASGAARLPLLRLRLATLFVFGVLLLTVGMFESFLHDELESGGGGIVGLQIVWGAIYAIALGWALLDVRRLTTLVFRSRFFFLAPLLAIASAAWAQEATPTLRRGLGLVFTYLLGAFIALNCDRREQLRLLIGNLLLAAALSYAVEILAPGWVPVVEAHPGSWNGVFPHKNMLAKAMVLLVTALLCFEPQSRAQRWVRRLGIPAALGLLVLSRAATGILVMAILIACYVILKQVHRSLGVVTLVLSVALGLIVVGSFYADSLEDSLLRWLGKSSDLSGRTSIWAVSLVSIAKRPWLGYGFHGFWRENNEAITARAFIPNHWDAPHAHNGYIEMLLELGIVGTVLMVIGFLLLLAKAVRRYRATGRRIDLWPVMLVLLLVFYNITESMEMVENTLTWILFTVAVFNAAAEQRPRIVAFDD